MRPEGQLALGLAEYFLGVSASFADRDLLFCNCEVLAGTGASAGSLHPVGVHESFHRD
jgi:hypothetical protein